ncbi:beta-1 adrenergic receptor-like [Megalops cyprinoides]|uniref:beta-1 adrenergic receptor-like n=1 Tax=Megalops cyprinoides TaxID=118141 RepID=UPI0018650450|nr:beta-1 adrenergic receptor-like [Megalops cyprinoides]
MNSTTNSSSVGPIHPAGGPWLALVITVIILVIVAGNMLVIIAIARTSQLQTTTNLFIASLAFADLIVGGLVVPLGATIVVTGDWKLSKRLCELWMSVDVMCVTASIETLCVIAVDRYVAVTRPLRHRQLLRKRWAGLTLCAVWAVAALISFVPIMTRIYRSHGVPRHEACYSVSACCDFITNAVYAIVSSVVSFYVPLCVMIFVYARVFLIATRQVRRIEQESQRFRSRHGHTHGDGVFRVPEFRSARQLVVREHRALKTVGIIIGSFTCCWLPFFVANIVIQSDYYELVTLLNWLGYLNSGLNPIIYCHSPEFRAAFRAVLGCPWVPAGHLETLYKRLRVHCPCFLGGAESGSEMGGSLGGALHLNGTVALNDVDELESQVLCSQEKKV